MRNVLSTALPLLLLAGVARADIGPGEVVEDGAIADITLAGLDFAEAQASMFIPSELTMEDMILDEEPFIGCTMHVEVYNLAVHTSLYSLEVTPLEDTLQVDVTVHVWINSQWDPLLLYLDGGDFLCWGINAECDVWTDVMTVTAQLQLALEVIDPGNGDPVYLDASVPSFTHNLDTAIDSSAIQLDCLLGTLIDFLGLLGVDVLGLIIDSAMADLYTQIEELPQTIEEAVEDGFDQVQYSDTLDVAGVPLDIDLTPHDIVIQPEGVRLMMNGAFDAPLAECVEAFDPGGSPFTDNPMPELDGTETYHVRALLADDLVASALYAVWRGGVLCYTVDPAELGFPLDTSFVALMADEEDRPLLERIWLDEPQPILLRTVPQNPPEVDFAGAHDLDARVEDLGLDFFAMTQDRMARVLTVDVDVDAGIGLVAPGDGTLEVEVEVDAENLDPVVSYDEFTGDLSEQIEQNFGDIMSGLLDTVLGTFLGDLAFGPLQIAGLGIAQLDVGPDGDALDYLGAEATFGLVTPECEGNLSAFGCSDSTDIGCGGEQDMGCSGGCDSGCSGDDDDSASGVPGDDDDSAADPCSCQSSCSDGSCGSSCDLRRTRAQGVFTANVLLISACLGVLGLMRWRVR